MLGNIWPNLQQMIEYFHLFNPLGFAADAEAAAGPQQLVPGCCSALEPGRLPGNDLDFSFTAGRRAKGRWNVYIHVCVFSIQVF